MKKLITILCFLLMLGTTVHGEVIDFSKKGDIEIILKDPENGRPVDVGEFTIYKIADINKELYDYVYTSEFSGMKVGLENLKSDVLTNALVEYIQANNIKGKSFSLDSEGMIQYLGVDLGIYLIVNNRMMIDYHKINPFIVTVPVDLDGSYEYFVDATPKLSLKVNDNSTPDAPVPDDTVPGGDIPVVGQLRWPIPFLAGGGAFLVLVGVIKKVKYEKNI